jgi:hypothetical protein
MQEEMGIGKLSIFKPYLSLLLWGSISRRIWFLCVCVCGRRIVVCGVNKPQFTNVFDFLIGGKENKDATQKNLKFAQCNVIKLFL